MELSFSNTVLCPPSEFEGVDLTTGPCRITSAKAVDLDSKLGENQVFLSENKQCINIADLFQSKRLAIFDRSSNDIIQEKTIIAPAQSLDFSTILPGFYEIRIFGEIDILYTITLIKCFPLVVTYDPKLGQYTTITTIW